MVDEAGALAVAIGGRVRAARQRRGWTLDRLAETAAVSRRTVVLVEQGEANPSVGTLLRLAGALGVGLPALVEPERTGEVAITRAGEGPQLWRGDRGGRAVLVAAADAPLVLELWDWRLAPGERRDSEAHAPGTRELLQVLDGTLRLHLDDTEELLAPGDAASFPGDRPHAYVNDGADPVRFALTVHEPEGRPHA